MNLELLQLVPQNSADSSKNSISSMNLQNDSLLEFAGNDEFFQQLQQEFNIFEQSIVEQKLPENGKNLPVVKGADDDSSEAIKLDEETNEVSDLLQSDGFINSNVMVAPALLAVPPVVLSPLDIKAGQQPVVLNNKPVNVLAETTDVIFEEVDASFSEGEATETEVPSELIQIELNRKSQVSLDSDVKTGRGDAGGAVSLATNYLSPSLKPMAAPTLNATLEAPVSDYDAWGSELNNRMAWMVSKDIKVASLRLNPVELGPMEVRIQIKNEQVDVLFNSTHSQVREAIEAAVPRLRDMFSEQLLRLDNVNISQHAFGDQKEQSKGHGEEIFTDGETHPAEDEPEESMSVLSSSTITGSGKIDYFV